MMNSLCSASPTLFPSRLRGAALSALLALAAPAAALLAPAAVLAQPAAAPAPVAPAVPAKAGAPAKAATAPAKSPAAGEDAAGAAQKARPAKPSKASARKKAPVPPVVEPEVMIMAADDQQLLAANEVYLGESGCEFDQKIELAANLLHPGYVDMSFNKKKYMMKPVMSTTGALRLEDIRSETLMIQISNKTMLMNQKTGQRLADNCVHINHRAVAADDVGQGLLRQ